MSKITNKCFSIVFNVIGMLLMILLVLVLDTNLGYNLGILGFVAVSILIWWDLFDIENIIKKLERDACQEKAE